jgi:hypothetical protein
LPLSMNLPTSRATSILYLSPADVMMFVRVRDR